jgi:DNA-binding transcriptional LysR family regulator
MTGFSSLNVERIKGRQVDLAFVRPPVDLDDEIWCVTLEHESVVLGVAVTNPLAESMLVNRADLAGEKLVFFSPESGGLWTSVLDAVYGPGQYPEISQIEPDEAHMLAAVAQGAGITLVTESAAAMLTVPGVVIKALAFEATVPLAVAWRRDNRNPALQEFLKMAGVKARARTRSTR